MSRFRPVALCLAVALFPTASTSQQPGTVSADRARMAQLVGDPVRHRGGKDLAALLRRLGVPDFARDSTFWLLPPDVRLVWNSAIPYAPRQDGPMWSGRGRNLALTAGMQGTQPIGRARLIVRIAPTVTYSENRPFEVIPDSTAGRSAYASPFHGPESSLDLPLRFGDRHLLRVFPGRSSVEVQLAEARAGVTAEVEQWGPAIRNPLVLSGNAAGIPRLFLSTARPLATPAGRLSGKLMVGTLTESMFFDQDLENDYRAVSGAVVQLATRWDTNFTIGLERVVYRSIRSSDGVFGETLARGLDALIAWGGSTSPPGDARLDQITGLFTRWVFPTAGFEVYGEWIRTELPTSMDELLAAFHHSLGYTLGFQYAARQGAGRYLRVQSEFTNLEQNRVLRDRPVIEMYSGKGAPQGYTQLGQVIGAPIGPGASSQWLAVDYVSPSWQLGGYIGRTRWENDALYRQQIPTLFKHDVSVLTGLRGARRLPAFDFSLDLGYAYRFNYLFQNGFANLGGFRTIDIRNFTLSMAITP